jgi:hypothetical protein
MRARMQDPAARRAFLMRLAMFSALKRAEELG